MAMGLIQNLIKWAMALVLFLMFPWLLIPVLIYFTWRRGILGRLASHGRHFLHVIGRWLPVFDASVSSGLARYEESIRYDAPSEDSPFVIVERDGERRVLCAIELRERAAARSDFGRVVGEVISSSLQATERIAFSFSITRRGGVGGLIILEYADPGTDGDFCAVSREIGTRLDNTRMAVAEAAPLLATRICRGRSIVLCGLRGMAE